MKRFKAALCDGVFAYADEDTAKRIMEEILKICGGSADTLSEVVQKTIILDHTPFHWTLSDKFSQSAVPPLFAKLVLACDKLLPVTQDEIMKIVQARFDSRLCANIKDKIEALSIFELSNESFFKDEKDRPTVTASPSYKTQDVYKGTRTLTQTVTYDIPKFFDRLIVDEEIWIQFFALGELSVCGYIPYLSPLTLPTLQVTCSVSEPWSYRPIPITPIHACSSK